MAQAPDHLLRYGVVQAKGYYMSADPECPGPERDTTRYHDVSTLERRRQYVQRLKQRDITPRTEQFANQYGHARLILTALPPLLNDLDEALSTTA